VLEARFEEQRNLGRLPDFAVQQALGHQRRNAQPGRQLRRPGRLRRGNGPAVFHAAHSDETATQLKSRRRPFRRPKRWGERAAGRSQTARTLIPPTPAKDCGANTGLGNDSAVFSGF